MRTAIDDGLSVTLEEEHALATLGLGKTEPLTLRFAPRWRAEGRVSCACE